MSVDYVAWEERFSVGVGVIDAQHKQLVELTNRLFDGCRKGGVEADQKFRESVKEAVEYVKQHFSTEEKLLLEHGYPEYAQHKQQHITFIQEILDRVNEYKRGNKFVPNQFVRFLREWLLEHIAVADQCYKNFLLSKGVN